MSDHTTIKQVAAQSANQYALMMAQQMETDKPKTVTTTAPSSLPTPQSTDEIVKRLNDKFNASSSTQRQRPNTRKIPQRATRWGRPKANPIQKVPKPQQMSGPASTVQVKAQATNAFALELARKAEEEAEKLKCRVTVGNLPPNYNIENLYTVFKTRADAMPTAVSPTTPRCCMVTFETAEQASQAALKVNGLQVIDRNLLVTLAGDTPKKDTEDIIARINARFKKLHNPNAVFEEEALTAPPPPPPPPPPPHPQEKKKGVDNDLQPSKKPRPEETIPPVTHTAGEQGFYTGMHPPGGVPYGPRIPMGQHPQVHPGMPPGSIPPGGMHPQTMPPQGIPSHGMPTHDSRPQVPRAMPPQVVYRHPMPPQAMPPRAAPPQAMPPRGMPPRGPPPRAPPPYAMPPRAMPPRAAPPRAAPPRAAPPRAAPPRAPPPHAMAQGMPQQGMPPQARPNQGNPGQPLQGAGPSSAGPSVVDKFAEMIKPDDQKVTEVNYLIKMQNVPRKATTNDIRVFFKELIIPPCGVEIIGGEDEVAYIRMKYHDDLLRATAMSGGYMMGQAVKTLLVTSEEMEKEKALILKQKQIRLQKLKLLKDKPEVQKPESKKPHSKFTMTWREPEQKEKILPNTAIILKAKPVMSAATRYVRSIMKDSSTQEIGNDLFNTLNKVDAKTGDSPSNIGTRDDVDSPRQSASDIGPPQETSFMSLFDGLRQAGIQTGNSPSGDAPQDDSGSDMELGSNSSDIVEGEDKEPKVEVSARQSPHPGAFQTSSNKTERKTPDRVAKDPGFYILVRNFDPELDEHNLMDYFIKRSVKVKSVIFKRMGDSSSAFVSFSIWDDRIFVLSMNGRKIGNLNIEIIEVNKARFKKALATYDTPSDRPTRHKDQGGSHQTRSRSPGSYHDRSRSPVRDHSLPCDRHTAPIALNEQTIKERPRDSASDTEPSFMSLFDDLRQAGIQTDHSPRKIGPRDNADSRTQNASDIGPPQEASFMSLFDGLRQAGIQTGDSPSNIDSKDTPSTRKHPTRDDRPTQSERDSEPAQEASFLSLFDGLRQAGIQPGNSPSNNDPIESEKLGQSGRDSEPPQEASFLSLFDGLREAGISTGDSPSNDDLKDAPSTRQNPTTHNRPTQSGRDSEPPQEGSFLSLFDGLRQAGIQTGDSPRSKDPKDPPSTRQNPTTHNRPTQSGRDSEPPQEASFLSLFDGLREAGISTGDSPSSDDPKNATEIRTSDTVQISQQATMNLAPWAKTPASRDEKLKQSGSDTQNNNGTKDAPLTTITPTMKASHKQSNCPSDSATSHLAPWTRKTAPTDDRPKQSGSDNNDPKDAPWSRKTPTTSDRLKQSNASIDNDPIDAPWTRTSPSTDEKPTQSASDTEPSFMSLFDDLRQAGIQTGDSPSNDHPTKDAPWTRKNPTTDGRPRESGSDSPKNSDPKDAPWIKNTATTDDIPKQSRSDSSRNDDPTKDAPWTKQTAATDGRPRESGSDSPRNNDPKDAPWTKKTATTDDIPKQSKIDSPRNDDPKDAPWTKTNQPTDDRPTQSAGDTESSFMSLFDDLRQAGIQTGDFPSNDDRAKDAPWTRKNLTQDDRPRGSGSNSPRNSDPKDAPWTKQKTNMKQSGSDCPSNNDPQDAPWTKTNQTTDDRPTQSASDTEPSFMSLFDDLRQAGIQTGDSSSNNDSAKDAPWTRKPPNTDERPRESESDCPRNGDPKDAPWTKQKTTSGSDCPSNNDPQDAPWTKTNQTTDDRPTQSAGDTESSFMSLFDDLRQAGIQTGDPGKSSRWSPEPPESSSS